jgi:hypothetical protein
MDWEAIIKFLFVVSGISGAFAFIGKKSVEAFLASRVEKYKSNLEIIATEHSIRFQQLHSERAQVIKVLYEKLVNLDLSLHSTLKHFQPAEEPNLEEKIKSLSKKHNELFYFYLPKKIFFEKHICDLLDSVMEKAKKVFIGITIYPIDTQNIEYKCNPELLKEKLELWEKGRNIFQNEITQLKKELEDKFRNLLGVDK